MTDIEMLKTEVGSVSKNHHMNVEMVSYLLENILLNGEYWDMLSPFSDNRVKRPGKKLASLLESWGFDICRHPTLEQCTYRFSVVSQTGDEFDITRFVLDYYNGFCESVK